MNARSKLQRVSGASRALLSLAALVALAVFGCGAESPVLLIHLVEAPVGTLSLRLTATLDDKPAQMPGMTSDNLQVVEVTPPGRSGMLGITVTALSGGQRSLGSGRLFVRLPLSQSLQMTLSLRANAAVDADGDGDPEGLDCDDHDARRFHGNSRPRNCCRCKDPASCALDHSKHSDTSICQGRCGVSFDFDCSGVIAPCFVDEDCDGYSPDDPSPGLRDCDDSNPKIHPGAAKYCGDPSHDWACDGQPQMGCVQCRSSSEDCAGVADRPVCNILLNNCVQCISDSGCSGATPRCNTIGEADTCVQCLSSADCGGATPVCDVTRHTCVQCIVGNTSQCIGVTPVCEPSQGKCVQCRPESVATDCNLAARTNSLCVNNQCGCRTPGDTCNPANLAGQVCKPGQSCVQCLVNADCPVGKFASIAPGNPNSVLLSCNPSTNLCVQCTQDADCANNPGNHFVCDPLSNLCVQCTAASTAACGGAAPVCNPSARRCVQCLSYASDCDQESSSACSAANACTCNGGAACSGATPVCDPNLNCVQCSAAHKDRCAGATSACNSATGKCVQCVDRSNCSGTKPACDTAANLCVQCTADADCAGISGKPRCDPRSLQCVECLTSSDCGSNANACSGNVCKCKGGAECVLGSAAPLCSSNATPLVCVQCNKDSDCGGATPVCRVASGTCVQCAANNTSQCTGATSVCDTVANLCGECIGDGHCRSPRPACLTPNDICVECTAANKSACSGNKKQCRTDFNLCVQCLSAATDCDLLSTNTCSTNNECRCNGAPPCSGGTPVCELSLGCVECSAAQMGLCAGVANGRATCNAGLCGIACDAGYSLCGSACLALQSDARNCGSCGRVCALAHATSSCALGVCRIAACDAGWADCNDDPSDGCETHVDADANNCGGCGVVCSIDHVSLRRCIGGACAGTCSSGWVDCNNDKRTDGCESACKIYYRDDDGDSFGKDGDTQCLCGPTSPYTAIVGKDCCDSNADVHPGSTLFQGAAAVGCALPYDYDCDGTETKETVQHTTCNCFPGTVGTPGWCNGTPNCGMTDQWCSGCTYRGTNWCQDVSGGSRQQRCR